MIQDRICRECGEDFKGGPRAYYCPSCRVERQKQHARDYKKRKRSGEVRPLGSKNKCERCGAEYTVQAGSQRFCPECQPIHAAEYDRVTSLEFYNQHKDRINPPRKLKRRKRSNICVWCGNEFEPVNGSTTCSDECKRLYRNKYMREYNKRKNGAPETQTDNTASPARLDLTGEKYGMLTVISETSRIGKHRRYICRCDCGNEVPVKMDSLRSGNTKSCGCLKAKTPPPKFKDLTGKRYGRLVVIERSYEKARNNHSFWLCKCDCGNTRIADSADLHNGVTTNCGRRCPLGKRPIINPERHLKQQAYRKEYNQKKKKGPAST